MTSRCFIVAGVSSGSGKTTVAIALMAALKKRGLSVQPFKAGPDYIDPGHHTALCGRPSYNLDTWMMGVDEVRASFLKALSGAEVGVVEGVMGLFDGKEGRNREGSTAHLAKVLNLPVILVVDARSMAGSAAALLYGFENYDPEVNVAGVIFNRVGSERHFTMLKGAVEERCRAAVLGYLPRDEKITIPERHLGLVTSTEVYGKTTPLNLDRLAGITERHVDIEEILGAAGAVEKVVKTRYDAAPSVGRYGLSPRIAVARDRAFCFYYQQNLDILRELGAEILFFSPLEERGLPTGTDGIYFGGGYPELHAGLLAANTTLMEEIRDHAERGIPVYAECGGLMYLGKELINLEGCSFDMAGLFPWTSKMLSRRKSLGYREVTAVDGCPFLSTGEKVRGHEFHYSEIAAPDNLSRVYLVTGNNKESVAEEGYLYKNTLASYIHLHFGSNRKFAEGFINMCRVTTETRANSNINRESGELS